MKSDLKHKSQDAPPPAISLVDFAVTPKMLTYLQALLAEGAHGSTLTEVVERLIWDSIRNCVRDGWIDRRPHTGAKP